ncbi:hypothetical protein AB0A63_13960 [Lentzea sp. NPDC042327]|uniref:hypothetical protein n=1 Tax=Lentzea sp. NPDC042327 TaxID=3154801 RepID=UPI00340C0CC6
MSAGEPADSGGGAGDRDAQITTLINLAETLKRKLARLELKLNELAARIPAETQTEEEDPAAPAAWVWFIPPAAAENDPGGDEDPRFTVGNFVAWYNVTFVGVDGGRARPIPPCWPQHPGLAMEIAALAYTWRAANIGPAATERDAQQWLHQWRPGFADRLARDWVHPDCLDSDHRDEQAVRANRFELAAQIADEPTPEP